MPQTKKQEIVYTVMMVCVMVYGMVCYNIALDVGGMQNFSFAAALSELPIMGVIGFLLDTFLVGPAAMRIAMGSPKTKTPRKPAARGPIAPRMAVGVLPINVMACVVQ